MVVVCRGRLSWRKFQVYTAKSRPHLDKSRPLSFWLGLGYPASTSEHCDDYVTKAMANKSSAGICSTEICTTYGLMIYAESAKAKEHELNPSTVRNRGWYLMARMSRTRDIRRDRRWRLIRNRRYYASPPFSRHCHWPRNGAERLEP